MADLGLFAAEKRRRQAGVTDGFFFEYRIGDEQSPPLLLSCRSLILDRDRMRTKPVKGPPQNQQLRNGDSLAMPLTRVYVECVGSNPIRIFYG
jgi:hypothetical protein